MINDTPRPRDNPRVGLLANLGRQRHTTSTAREATATPCKPHCCPGDSCCSPGCCCWPGDSCCCRCWPVGAGLATAAARLAAAAGLQRTTWKSRGNAGCQQDRRTAGSRGSNRMHRIPSTQPASLGQGPRPNESGWPNCWNHMPPMGGAGAPHP